MSYPADYNPPKVWKWEVPSGGTFSKINKPTSGPTHKKKTEHRHSSNTAILSRYT